MILVFCVKTVEAVFAGLNLYTLEERLVSFLDGFVALREEVKLRRLKQPVYLFDPGIVAIPTMRAFFQIVAYAIFDELFTSHTIDEVFNIGQEFFIAAIWEMNFEGQRFDRRQEVQKFQSLFLAEPGQELFKDFNELVRGKAPQLFFQISGSWLSTGNSA